MAPLALLHVIRSLSVSQLYPALDSLLAAAVPMMPVRYTLLLVLLRREPYRTLNTLFFSHNPWAPQGHNGHNGNNGIISVLWPLGQLEGVGGK